MIAPEHLRVIQRAERARLAACLQFAMIGALGGVLDAESRPAFSSALRNEMAAAAAAAAEDGNVLNAAALPGDAEASVYSSCLDFAGLAAEASLLARPAKALLVPLEDESPIAGHRWCQWRHEQL